MAGSGGDRTDPVNAHTSLGSIEPNGAFFGMLQMRDLPIGGLAFQFNGEPSGRDRQSGIILKPPPASAARCSAICCSAIRARASASVRKPPMDK